MRLHDFAMEMDDKPYEMDSDEWDTEDSLYELPSDCENDSDASDYGDTHEIYKEITALREALLDALMKPIEQKDSNEVKEEEHAFLHPPGYYEGLVLTEVPDIDALEPEVEFVETTEQKDIWRFLQRHTSSIKTHTNVGRNLKMLIFDKHTGKYIGILTLGSDIYAYDARDKAIGWTKDNLRRRLQYIANIWGCVGLQPISYNYNVGKLLTSLCFTKEVLDAYEHRYGIRLAAITTFGAYGKAVQYERLPYIKYVGQTKGMNACRIPDDLYERACQLYCKVYRIKAFGMNRGRLSVITQLFRWLNISQSLLKEEGIKRGVYLGYTTPTSKAFLNETIPLLEWPNNLPTVKSVSDWWKERWAKPRLQHLKDTNRFNIETTVQWTWKPLEDNYVVNPRNRSRITEVHQYNMTEEELKYHRSKTLSPGYIAGFMDGDGTISYYGSQHSVYISIFQCDPRPLIALQAMYGGRIRTTIPHSNHERRQYNYCLRKHTEPLLKLLANHCILKSKRAQYCYEQLYGKDALEKQERKELMELPEHEAVVKRIKELQMDFNPVNNDYTSRLTHAYCAGFFDAEGYIDASGTRKLYNNFMINITQKSNPTILKAISRRYGYGKCKGFRWVEYKQANIADFFQHTMKYLIVKKEQAEALERVYDLPNGLKSFEKEDIHLIRTLKHREYIIAPEKIKEWNAKGLIKFKTWKTPRCLKPRKDKIKQTRCTKGKPLAIQHAAAIAVQNTLKRRTIPDEQIDRVREMLKTMTQTKVAKELDLKRDDVYKIAHGTLLKTTELTVETKQEQILKKRERKATKTKEERVMEGNINRRKIPLETMIWILKKIQEPNQTPTSVFDALKAIGEANGNPVRYTLLPIQKIINGMTRPYDIEYPLLGTITKQEYEGWLAHIQTIDFNAARRVQMGKKVRSVQPETIMRIYLRWEQKPLYERNDLAREFQINTSTLRRFIQHPELYYPCDFPVEVNGRTYTYDDFLELAKEYQKN